MSNFGKVLGVDGWQDSFMQGLAPPEEPYTEVEQKWCCNKNGWWEAWTVPNEDGTPSVGPGHMIFHPEWRCEKCQGNGAPHPLCKNPTNNDVFEPCLDKIECEFKCRKPPDKEEEPEKCWTCNTPIPPGKFNSADPDQDGIPGYIACPSQMSGPVPPNPCYQIDCDLCNQFMEPINGFEWPPPKWICFDNEQDCKNHHCCKDTDPFGDVSPSGDGTVVTPDRCCMLVEWIEGLFFIRPVHDIPDWEWDEDPQSTIRKYKLAGVIKNKARHVCLDRRSDSVTLFSEFEDFGVLSESAIWQLPQFSTKITCEEGKCPVVHKNIGPPGSPNYSSDTAADKLDFAFKFNARPQAPLPHTEGPFTRPVTPIPEGGLYDPATVSWEGLPQMYLWSVQWKECTRQGFPDSDISGRSSCRKPGEWAPGFEHIDIPPSRPCDEGTEESIEVGGIYGPGTTGPGEDFTIEFDLGALGALAEVIPGYEGSILTDIFGCQTLFMQEFIKHPAMQGKFGKAWECYYLGHEGPLRSPGATNAPMQLLSQMRDIPIVGDALHELSKILDFFDFNEDPCMPPSTDIPPFCEYF